MTSLTNRCSVNTAPIHHQRHRIHRRRSDSLPIVPLRRRTSRGSIISAAVSSPNRGAVSLDGWIRDSVVEIVKNLRESPLLLQVFADGNGEKPELSQKAVSDDWVEMKRGWVSGNAPAPDGLILVEKLAGEESPECEKAWGIVVQGKGAGSGSVCYLLKTCRAGSAIGYGATHFCLMKVRNLRDSALSQLNSVWLPE